ncbi:MAG: hypothetical protein ACRDOM_10590 [Nocardioides sp.]
MPLRRSLALTAGAILLSAPLTSCGFDYATDRIYTPATGANNRDASVDVLGAVIVASEDGSGTFIASFANNDNEEPVTVEGVEGVATQSTQLEASGSSPVEVPPGGLVNLADEGGFEVTGEFTIGDFVGVALPLSTGERIQVEVPVVTNCGYYEGLDGSSDPEQCETGHETGEH